MLSIENIAKQAKVAAKSLLAVNSSIIDDILKDVAKEIELSQKHILDANELDIALAKEKNLSDAMIDRLTLNEQRLADIKKGLLDISLLPSPLGKTLASWTRPNGLKIERVTTPIGVAAVIYESRPNVTIDAAALCLKSGNACILRSGSESTNSSIALANCFRKALLNHAMDENIIQIISSSNRALMKELLWQDKYIDVVIPRGGRGLIEFVQKESRIPLFMHLEGLNNSYVDKYANIDKATKIIKNAKMRRVGICGATENLIVHKDIAKEFLPTIYKELTELGCEVRGDESAKRILDNIIMTNEEDFHTEYLDAIISVKIVDSLSDAISFIDKHNSQHTDAIITEDETRATEFLNQVDSAIVMWNCSTQFADGGEFGMGAEIGISTGRMHARGPVGVEQLVTFKYKVYGNGQVRPR